MALYEGCFTILISFLYLQYIKLTYELLNSQNENVIALMLLFSEMKNCLIYTISLILFVILKNLVNQKLWENWNFVTNKKKL